MIYRNDWPTNNRITDDNSRLWIHNVRDITINILFDILLISVVCDSSGDTDTRAALLKANLSPTYHQRPSSERLHQWWPRETGSQLRASSDSTART